ncbi:NAD(P)-dependent oxidoreductase [Xanthobacter oligotrophicus]|uniref:NAD(P)-dependent oxidoreductase n=1 Tax=Xanthobacter oligotrophicus TaxID=2607286 RepID=A0ABW6ZVM5_9HYPH
MLIASQLEPFFNNVLADRLGAEVLPVPRGAPAALPAEARILVAAPMFGVWDLPHLPEPPDPPEGWPFGLEWIQLVSSGTDHYPRWFLNSLPASTARGVAAGPIAEFVIGTIFEAVKALHTVWIGDPQAWRTRPFAPIEGTTLGLLGYGAIGRAVARRALGLGMRVHALRRSAPAAEDGVAFVRSVEELLAVSDHLVLAAPATPQTRHILNADSLRAAKPGIHIINVARGSLIDDDALLDALADGRVGRATLDTTTPEPLAAGHPFYSHPRVRVSPHTAAIGSGARLALVEKLAANLERRGQGLGLLDPP